MELAQLITRVYKNETNPLAPCHIHQILIEDLYHNGYTHVRFFDTIIDVDYEYHAFGWGFAALK